MSLPRAVAKQYRGALDAGKFPAREAWGAPQPVTYCADWQGKNADAECSTEVRVLWTRENLYLRFAARYRVITVFADAEASGRRDQLWDRDVVEAFLQPQPAALRGYKEFEVSPNGYWIDLHIAPEGKRDLQSGLRRRVNVDENRKVWTAELAIPMASLTQRFDPGAVWRANFFRVEGPREPRFYSAWSPTQTPSPNFHVPEKFGELVFA